MEYRSKVEMISHTSVTPRHLYPKTGSRATLHTWALPLPTYVRLDFPQQGSNLDGREALLQAIEKTPGILLCTHDTEATATFTVSLNAKNHLEIRDEQGGKLNGIPELSLGHENAAQKLAYILRHLMRFRAIKKQQYGSTRKLLPSSNFKFEL